MMEAHVYEELLNICQNQPLWPGSTISHRTADECGRRGWATRNADGCWIPTEDGVIALQSWVNPKVPPYDLERPLKPCDSDPVDQGLGCAISIISLVLTAVLAWWLLGCASTPERPQDAPGEAYSCREVLALQIEAERRWEAIRHLQLIALHGPDGMGQRASPAEASNRRAWARTLRAARMQAWDEVLRWRSECRI